MRDKDEVGRIHNECKYITNMASSTSYGPNGEHAAHHGVATTTQQIEHSDSTRI
jgi:hypothetical protein